MKLGTPLVIECPHCGYKALSERLESGNAFGATFWSDGKMEAPMMPATVPITSCHKCQNLFWLKDAKEINFDGAESSASQDYKYHLNHAHTIPRTVSVKDLIRALELGLARNPEEEKILRIRLWWALNDLIRRKLNSQLKTREAIIFRDNLTRLEELIPETNPKEFLLEAELLRVSGQFQKCLDILSKIDNVNREFCDAMRDAAQRGISVGPFIYEYAKYGFDVALVLSGPKSNAAIKPLCSLLNHENYEVRSLAIYKLSENGMPDAVKGLFSACQLNGLAALALSKLNCILRRKHLSAGTLESLREVTIAALYSESDDVLFEALEIMCSFKFVVETELLIKQLRHPDNSGLRWRTAWILGEQGDSKVVPELIKALAFPNDEWLHGHAAWALKRITGQNFPVDNIADRRLVFTNSGMQNHTFRQDVAKWKSWYSSQDNLT
jgi:hypothetical protein